MQETLLNAQDTSNGGDDATNSIRNLLLLSNQQPNLVDIVADPINDSSLPNLSTRSDSDGDWLIVMTVVKLAASGLSLKAHDSKNVLLCFANLKHRNCS